MLAFAQPTPRPFLFCLLLSLPWMGCSDDSDDAAGSSTSGTSTMNSITSGSGSNTTTGTDSTTNTTSTSSSGTSMGTSTTAAATSTQGSTTSAATSTTGAATSTGNGGATSTTGGASTAGGGAGGGGASGTATTGGSDPCPSDASFCSSFESSDLPEGAVYKLNGNPATPWTTDFEVDTTLAHSGASSLRVRPSGEGSGAYKMLAVPTPGANFWVRFYLHSDTQLGVADHNVFTAAAGSDDPNESINVEFAEDVGLAFNSHDAVRWPEGFGRLGDGGTNPYTLPADAWHCIEIHYDGSARVQQLYVEGSLLIDAQSYPDQNQAFTTFKFGYNALHGTMRNTWYDDVVVAASQIGCL